MAGVSTSQRRRRRSWRRSEAALSGELLPVSSAMPPEYGRHATWLVVCVEKAAELGRASDAVRRDRTEQAACPGAPGWAAAGGAERHP